MRVTTARPKAYVRVCPVSQGRLTGSPLEVDIGKPLAERMPDPTRIVRGVEKSLCKPLGSST